MKKNLLFFMAVTLSLLWQTAMAQTRIVSGNVRDAKGDAVNGASISVKGTTTGTLSDDKGNFSLALPTNATSITISYLGMKTQEVILGASNVVNVNMEDDVLGLDAVVVTAIGMSAQKKSLGYSVQDLDGDALTKAGQSNSLTALSGKIAGLQVIQSSGSPGSSVSLKLRGATSVYGDNSPLIVVDGVPIDNSENYSGNPDNQSNNNLIQSVGNSNRGVDINPDDIESVTVLKGPAATALYGLKASNGAIVITTKKGGQVAGGGVNVSYSANLTFDKVNKTPDLQDMFVKGSGGKIRSYESGSSGSWGPMYDTLFWDPSTPSDYNKNGALITKTAAASIPGAIPFTRFNNVDQFFRTGKTWEHSLALSGGNNNSSYRFSFSALNQNGIVPLSDFSRYTAKMSGKTNLSSKWYTAGSVSYTKSGGARVQQGSNLSGLMLDLLRTPISFDNSNGSDDPTDPSAYILDDGTQRNYRGGGGYDNPYWTINQNPFHDDVNRMFGYAEVGFKACSWLNLTYRIGSDFYSDRRNQFFAINSRAYTAGQIFEQDNFYRHVNSDLFASANKTFSKNLTGSLTIGQNMYSRYNQSIYVQGDGLNFTDFRNFSVASNILTRESHSRYRTAAMYAAGSLGYKNMLYLNLTGRNEMSSTLPADNNSFFYPSVSVSYVFTEQFKMSTNKWFPYGKIRISTAKVGKDADPYSLANYFSQSAFADGWTPGIAFPIPTIIGTNIYNVVGFTNGITLGNPTLRPEKTTSTEIGADLRFINNRIGLDITYYTSKSTDQILPSPVAGSTGYQYSIQNTGSISNKGWELELNITPIKTKSLEWSIGVNWSTNKSLVNSLGDTSIKALFLGGFEGSAVYAVQGQPYGSIYGSRWLRDANGAIIIDDDPNSGGYGYAIMDNQVGVIGDINPDWIMGINNTLTFKERISFGFVIDVRKGGDIWNGTKGALTFFGRSELTENRGDSVIMAGVGGHYDVDGNVITAGTTNDVKVVLDQAWYQGLGGGFGGPAEQFVEDGSYVKLRELSLSYSFNKNCFKNTPIGGIDISFIGRNLWLKTKYTGVDPETSLTGSGNSQGMDYFNMPNTKSWGFSLHVTL